jgi:hypothetical protein
MEDASNNRDANGRDASNTMERQQQKGRYCTQKTQQQQRHQEQIAGTLTIARTSAIAWTPAKAGSAGTAGTPMTRIPAIPWNASNRRGATERKKASNSRDTRNSVRGRCH